MRLSCICAEWDGDLPGGIGIAAAIDQHLSVEKKSVPLKKSKVNTGTSSANRRAVFALCLVIGSMDDVMAAYKSPVVHKRCRTVLDHTQKALNLYDAKLSPRQQYKIWLRDQAIKPHTRNGRMLAPEVTSLVSLIISEQWKEIKRQIERQKKPWKREKNIEREQAFSELSEALAHLHDYIDQRGDRVEVYDMAQAIANEYLAVEI